jgi:hypothetical protein
MPYHGMLIRIRSEYLEMPGLRLTVDQARRLWGIEHALCERVLDALVETNFLCVKSDGSYARTTDGADNPHPQPTKIVLSAEQRARTS